MNVNISENRSDKLWKFCEDLIAICILGALWILCSLPIVTIGATTTAMYTVFMNHIIHGRKELAKPFFIAFKENFKNATIVWLIICLLMSLLALDVYYYLYLSGSSTFHRTVGIVMLCILAIVIFVSCYAFPMIALYNSTVKDTLIKSVQYSYIRWPWTLLAFLVKMTVPVLVFIGLWYYAFIFAGTAGFANSHIMLKAFKHDINCVEKHKK